MYYLENSDFSQDGKLLVSSDKPVVILLKADYCGHCKTFKPEFEKAVSLAGDRVNFATIQLDGGDTERELGKRVGQFIPNFQGVPTVVIYKNGKYTDTYEGPRQAEALVEYLSKI